MKISVMDADGQTKYGFIDERGKMVIPPEWEDAREFAEGMCQVSRGSRTSYIDVWGRIVFTEPEDWADVGHFSEGLAVVNVAGVPSFMLITGGRWGIINTRGHFVVRPKFEFPGDMVADWLGPFGYFSEGVISMATPQRKWGFVDRKGTWEIPPRFDAVRPFRNGLAQAMVRSSGGDGKVHQRWGYIDHSGQFVWSTSGDGLDAPWPNGAP